MQNLGKLAITNPNLNLLGWVATEVVVWLLGLVTDGGR